MIPLKRTHQSGAVLTFIIVAVVLTFVVIGTAYFVKQKGEQARKEQAIAQADKLIKEQDTSTTKPTDSSAKSSSEASTDKPAPAPSESKTPAPTTSAPTTPSPTPAPSDQATLPITGPESDVTRILAIGLIVASSAAYVSSRRALDRSL